MKATSQAKILLLDRWPESRIEKFWRMTKILIKDGLIYHDWKNIFRDKSTGGNMTLTQSLASELRRQGLEFTYNAFDAESEYDYALVVKDTRCLKWAIKQKQAGRIAKIIAGPLIVSLPSESNRIIEDPSVDTIIVASQWVREMFLKLALRKDLPIAVWPIGVNLKFWTPLQRSARDKVILFIKNPSGEVLSQVRRDLRGHNVVEMISGTFSQVEYLKVLRQSRGIIFLSASETQGLAMFEAWACNVPTLIWDPGTFKYQSIRLDIASSCPYLNRACGIRFKNADEFASSFKRFSNMLDSFRPREFVMKNYTLESSVRKFLEITKIRPAHEIQQPLKNHLPQQASQ